MRLMSNARDLEALWERCEMSLPFVATISFIGEIMHHEVVVESSAEQCFCCVLRLAVEGEARWEEC